MAFQFLADRAHPVDVQAMSAPTVKLFRAMD
jgi:hypothetical protein